MKLLIRQPKQKRLSQEKGPLCKHKFIFHNMLTNNMITCYLTCLFFRSRPSPNKKIVKKLLLEDTATEDGGCEHDSPKPRYLLAANYLVLQKCI